MHAKMMKNLLHGANTLTPERRKSLLPTKQSGNDVTKLETLYILSPFLKTTTSTNETQGLLSQFSDDISSSPVPTLHSPPLGSDDVATPPKPRPHRPSVVTQAELDKMGLNEKRTNFRRETLHSSASGRTSSNDMLREVRSVELQHANSTRTQTQTQNTNTGTRSISGLLETASTS